MTKHLRLIMLSLLAMICLGGGIRRVKLCTKRSLSQMKTMRIIMPAVMIKHG